MTYTETQILEKSKKILQDIQKEYFFESNIKAVRFDKNELVRGMTDKTMPCWIISVKEPVFDTLQFLTISDISGEPLYWQTSMVNIVEIAINEEGTYIVKNK